jgi:DNA-binding NtrC family response regulator
MSTVEIAAEGRDYPRVIRAILDTIRVMDAEGDQTAALRQSFEEAAAGFGAEKALLLRVDESEAPKLVSLCATGLTPKQIAALEQGESIRGVSHTIIRDALETKQLQLMTHPSFRRKAGVTKAFTDQDDFSVLCAPILDHSRERSLAVMYFQNSGGPALTRAYQDSDARLFDAFCESVQRVFRVFFEKQETERQYQELLAGRERPEDTPDIIGNSPQTAALRLDLHEVWIPTIDTKEPAPILIRGETGVGKDLVARYLHAWSSRRNRPFIVCNAGTIPAEPAMARAQLHGHTRNAFTGAERDEPGYFRAARGGVLFIDEIGELTEQGQLSLLRALDTFKVSPLGDPKEYPVDVFIILATNRDLEDATRNGSIRLDFLRRFATQTVTVPPLRDRPTDILPLIDAFIRERERNARKRTSGFTDDALEALLSYSWPGNVRDVKNACTAIVNHVKPGQRIDLSLLERSYPDAVKGPRNPDATAALGMTLPLKDAVHLFQKDLFRARLEHHGGNVTAAAQSLGLDHKSTFYRMARRLGVVIRESTTT